MTSSSAFASLTLLGRGVVEPSGQYSLAFVCTGPETSMLEQCSEVHLTLFEGDRAIQFHPKPLIMPQAPTEALFLKASQNLLEFFYVDEVKSFGADPDRPRQLVGYDMFKGFGFSNKDGYNWSTQPIKISKQRLVNLIKLFNHQGEYMTDIRLHRYHKLSREQKELRDQGVCFPMVISSYKGTIAYEGSYFSKKQICK